MFYERQPTDRQREIFQHVANGREYGDIATSLGISKARVVNVVTIFQQLLGLDTPGAIAEARKRGWIT